MAVLTIDLNAPKVGAQKQIWIVHAGKSRQFTDFFVSHSLVALEYPGLSLANIDMTDDGAIRQRLRFSHAVRGSKGFVREDGSQILLSDFKTTPDDDVAVALGTVKHLALRIRPGDLVIVPGKGSQSPVLFGEVVGDFNPRDLVRLPKIDYAEVPFRRVRWLSTDRLKRELPVNLQKYFEKPPAIYRVRRDETSERFFDYAYASYFTDRLSWALIEAPAYDGADLRATRAPTDTVIFGLSLFEAVISGDNFSQLSYDEIISKYFDPSHLYALGVSYQSPGRYPTKARNPLAALFLSAFIAVSATQGLAACSKEPDRVGVINSAAPDDESASRIERMIRSAATDAGGAALQTSDKKVRRARQEVNLSSPADLRDDS